MKSSSKKNAKKRKKKKNPILIAIFSLFLISGIALSFLAYHFYALYQKGGIVVDKTEPKKTIDISIKTGTTPKEIANALEKDSIVDNASLFYLKAKNDGIATNFKAGEFELNNYMTYDEVVETLQNPSQIKGLKLLVKEGQTQEDIARTLDEIGIVSYEEFMSACNDIDYDYSFLKDLPKDANRTSKLEGYLYPDTYYLSNEDTAKSIVNKLLSRFDELYTQDIAQKAKALNLTTDEVVTIASIIEKEVVVPEEKPIVASVIFNRLNQGIKLQMDATVLYAKKEHKDRTLISDTKVESGYNTYFVDGLPIGPISNPSIDTMKAVVNPAKTDYIYYVVQNPSTGEHFFTSNYDEFLQAKEVYIKNFD